MNLRNNEKRVFYKEAYEKLRLHFVYNSMNAVKYYIRKNPETAASMIDNLAVFLRGNVENALEEKWIALSEELKFARAYAELECAGNRRLKVEWLFASKEGTVLSGSIYRSIEKMVKKYVYENGEECTIWIMDEEDGSAVCVWVEGKEEKDLIPIRMSAEDGGEGSFNEDYHCR